MPTPFPRATWRLILSDTADGATNMAVDEALLTSVIRGESDPILRFYRWSPPALSLGIGQSFACIDEAACTQNGWHIVRRSTGGRAILHTDELTYSVIAPLTDPRVAGGIPASYQRLGRALAAGLAQMGIHTDQALGQDNTPRAQKGPICFDVPADYELTIGGRKLIGSAQMRRRGAMVQHGTLPLRGDIGRIVHGLIYETEAERDADLYSLRKKSTTAETLLPHPASWAETAQHLQDGFARTLNLTFTPSHLTPSEQNRADELRRAKYAHDSWTKRR